MQHGCDRSVASHAYEESTVHVRRQDSAIIVAGPSVVDE